MHCHRIKQASSFQRFLKLLEGDRTNQELLHLADQEHLSMRPSRQRQPRGNKRVRGPTPTSTLPAVPSVHAAASLQIFAGVDFETQSLWTRQFYGMSENWLCRINLLLPSTGVNPPINPREKWQIVCLIFERGDPIRSRARNWKMASNCRRVITTFLLRSVWLPVNRLRMPNSSNTPPKGTNLIIQLRKKQQQQRNESIPSITWSSHGINIHELEIRISESQGGVFHSVFALPFTGQTQRCENLN